MIDTSADCAKCDPLDGIAQTLDHASAAAIAQMTSGLSPVTMMQAGLDWCAHLTISPGKRLQLAGKAGRKVQRITDYAVRRVGQVDAAPAIEPLPQDRRFIGPAWRQFPFDLISQSFLLTQQWWHAAT